LPEASIDRRYAAGGDPSAGGFFYRFFASPLIGALQRSSARQNDLVFPGTPFL
jgi:hypothetical protein